MNMKTCCGFNFIIQ